jgi:hypothetical protein
MFTTKPFSPETLLNTVPEKPGTMNGTTAQKSQHIASDDIVGILQLITPNLPKILVENDRILGAIATVSANIVAPAIKSKHFPQTASLELLAMVYQLARIPGTQKVWKRDVSEAFYDTRFFGANVNVAREQWLPLLRQWCLGDKEKMPELLLRITPPTTAGIVFGVGASSARAEADRRTQLNLRRIATLILSADDDTFVINLTGIEEKLVELLGATAASSPSSATRAEIYMVLRALLLKTNYIHMGLFWPIINAELENAITSIFSGQSDLYNNFSILQACKLLDLLLTISPDDFQLHEWLFITDSIDAIHGIDHESVALADEAARQLHSKPSSNYMETSTVDDTKHQLLLGKAKTSNQKGEDIVGKILRPFFSQLSIHSYERTYSMGVPDILACRESLLDDLFDESSIVS